MIEDGFGVRDGLFGASGSGARGAKGLRFRDKQRGECYLDV